MKVQYDPEYDIISAETRGKKVYQTIEFSEHVLVDISEDGIALGIEILDASEEISKLFNRVVKKEEMKQLLCYIKSEPHKEYLISFESPDQRKTASVMFSLYRSPVLSS